MKRLGSALVLSCLAGAFAFGVSAMRAEAKPPVCPKIYAPVICDDGKVYPNQCVADSRNATGCVPLGL